MNRSHVLVFSLFLIVSLPSCGNKSLKAQAQSPTSREMSAAASAENGHTFLGSCTKADGLCKEEWGTQAGGTTLLQSNCESSTGGTAPGTWSSATYCPTSGSIGFCHYTYAGSGLFYDLFLTSSLDGASMGPDQATQYCDQLSGTFTAL
jgi:hypothetical protein